jgi:hypothetical protein
VPQGVWVRVPPSALITLKGHALIGSALSGFFFTENDVAEPKSLVARSSQLEAL